MLDGLFMLLTLSTVMAIASFLAGSLPLSFTLSHSQLRLISTIGMGVLVGTSLIVIIPEGIETLYSAGDSPHTHMRRAISSPSLDVRWLPGQAWPSSSNSPPSEPFDALPGPVIPAGLDLTSSDETTPPKTPTTPGEIGILGDSATTTPSISSDEPTQTSHRTPHAWVGLSLILGFILMYLIDVLPTLSAPRPSSQTHNIYSLSDLSTTPSPSSSQTPPRSLATTLGLCIHAVADGIALGASSTTPSSLSLIIFLAIMIHKAPAAFGLTSVLLKQGLGKRGARAHLVVFSLAAPVGAMGTWMLVRLLGGGSGGLEGSEEGMRWWTGVVLLFSGGTFLYVAMHTMQEDDSGGHGHGETHGNGYIDGGMGRDARQKEGKSLRLVMAAVGGMLLPLITQIGHAH
ncbi:hypothetical protein MMC08_008098 [Hypocenomyce scalaris]|nr:hypothetical protein [Hypocenomyce scalaris]